MQHIWMILIKDTHTCKEVLLKSMKGKYLRYLHWYIIFFLLEENLRNVNRFLTEISPFGSHMEYIAKFFNVIILLKLWMLQSKTLFSAVVLNLINWRGRFKGESLECFFIKWTWGTCTILVKIIILTPSSFFF